MSFDILKGMATTLKNVVKKPTTISYPEQERKLPHLRPFAGEAVASAAHAAEVYDHARRRRWRWRRPGLGTNGRRGAETRSERVDCNVIFNANLA